MKTYLDCWVQAAANLFAQALAGAPELVPEPVPEPVDAPPKPVAGETFAYTARMAGEYAGPLSVILDAGILDAPLLGEGIDQKEAWEQLLREAAEAAAGAMAAAAGRPCRVEAFGPGGATKPATRPDRGAVTRAFVLKTGERAWMVLVCDGVRAAAAKASKAGAAAAGAGSPSAPTPEAGQRPGLELLLDVELEAALRFGSRELPLGEILELGPGDVVQLDRQVADPVDLIVADKVVARGEVVLVNGNFALRITEVAAPRKRLESIRCLF